jgi:hypothetical protein
MMMLLKKRERLPWLGAIQAQFPDFTLAQFRALQAGELVEVEDPALVEYLSSWCDKVDSEE